MRRARRRLTAGLIASFFCCCLLSGQEGVPRISSIVPRLVNISGMAADENGKAIQGIVGVTFAIYKGQNGGAALWLESQNVQADANGNYTAQLGATKPEGLPLDLFTSGEARWLGVTVNGGPEQARILLLSVPYALKAADAETLGGLPASAFVLATPPNVLSLESTRAINSTSQSGTPPPNSAVTGLGSASFLPVWDSASDIINSVIFQSGSGSTAKVGIGTSTPASTLDVLGAATIRGNLSLPATGVASSTGGKRSQSATLTASSFNSGTGAAVSQNFRWQAEPAGNNTIIPSGTLNLLFSSGTNNPKETGLKIANNGQITFANGQVFPGAGTISGVTAGTNLLGGGSNGNVTLSLDTAKVPQLVASNNFLGNQNVTGNVGVIGNVGIGTTTPGTTFDVFSSSAGVHAPMARFGSNGVNDANSIVAYTGSGIAEMFQSGCDNCFIPGVQVGDGGLRVSSGSIFFGDAFRSRLRLDVVGNLSQPIHAGGAAKATVLVMPDPIHGVLSIFRCFNSTLAAGSESVPPCGFTLDKVGVGDYIINFGFEVDDRFMSGTPVVAGNTISVCTTETSCPNLPRFDPNEVEVQSLRNGSFADTNFYLIVY